MVAIVYGSREFLDENLVEIEIRTISNKRIRNILLTNQPIELYIINKSPYKIKLIVDDDISTNYDGEPLHPYIKYYLWFKSETNRTLSLGGAKS
jgi:hypothetical protein